MTLTLWVLPSPCWHAKTRGIRAYREATQLPADCRSKIRGGASLQSIVSHAGRPDSPQKPIRHSGNHLMKVGKGTGPGSQLMGGRQEEAGETGYEAFPQHLEAFQRQQETSSSPSGSPPCRQASRLLAQSKMEEVGMCGNSYHRAREEGGTAHPVSAGHGDRDDSMTVIMIAVTIY